MNKYNFKDEDIIHLDVGGVYYTTTIATLKIIPKFTEDGKYFDYILNYLRENGDIKRACIPLKNEEIVERLCVECDYYCLNRLKYLLSHNGKFMESNMC